MGRKKGEMKRVIEGEGETALVYRKKEARERNRDLMEVEKAKEMITDKFIKEFPRYVEDKKEEFGKALKGYVRECGERLGDASIASKIPVLRIQEALCKPFMTNAGKNISKRYNAVHLQMASDFYWESVWKIQEEGFTYVPTLQQFARLMNISVHTLKGYMNNGDEEMRETMLMIRDRFIDYYSSRGMSRQISEVMSIFMLKAEYNIRDNDVPQTVINNNNISINSDMLEKLKMEESKMEGDNKLLEEV